MIHPISRVIRTMAMNPPISGQYMAGNHTAQPDAGPWSGVQRDLLVGRGERPCDLQPPLLAEHEPKLARRPEPLWVSGAECRARAALGDRTEAVLMKEAILAACLA